MRLLLGCLVLMGCHSDDTATPPADSGSPVSDGPAQSHGLSIAWHASPALPGPVRTDLIVTSATFKLARVQAVGDAGGDERTNIDLTWAPRVPAPSPVELLSAPTGIYSKVTLDIDAGLLDAAYQINGTCNVAGTTRMFEIRDRDQLDIQINGFDQTLQPGGEATLVVDVDLKDALEGIDYEHLDDQGGTLVLDNNDPQMSNFRDHLKDAFKRGN
jgi:hypothetical protein